MFSSDGKDYETYVFFSLTSTPKTDMDYKNNSLKISIDNIELFKDSGLRHGYQYLNNSRVATDTIMLGDSNKHFFKIGKSKITDKLLNSINFEDDFYLLTDGNKLYVETPLERIDFFY